MKKTFTKVLALVLTACMLVSVLPVITSAATSTVSTWAALKTAVASASAGDTIVLGANLTATDTLTVNGSVTIDGAGKTITRSGKATVFAVEGALTLTNVTVNGAISSTAVADLGYTLVSVGANGDFTLGASTLLTTNRVNATYGGAAGVTVNGGNFTMLEGSRLYDLHVHNEQSSIAVAPAVQIASGTFTMNGGQITNCDAKIGAIYNAGTFTMYGGTIKDNIANASGAGGGAVFNAGTFNLAGGTLTTNTSWVSAGAVYNAGTMNMTSGEISSNVVNKPNATSSEYATMVGGAIVTTGTLNISGGSIINNTAKGSTGGIQVSGGTTTLSGGTIQGNVAQTYSGGGLFVSLGQFVMTGGTITGNTATQFGGALAVTADNANAVNITGGTIIGNTCGSGRSGSDIYTTQATVKCMTSYGTGCIVYNLYVDTNGKSATQQTSTTLTAGYGYKFVSSGAGHTFGDWIVDQIADCQKDGIRHRICSVCQYREDENSGKGPHNNMTETVAATCTTDGYRKNSCPTCGTVFSNTVLPATGHIASEYWTVETPATASSNGTKVKRCYSCGQICESASYAASAARLSVNVGEPQSKNASTNTVTVTVKAETNPGVWAMGFYLVADEAFTAVSVTDGTVFSDFTEPGINLTVGETMEELFAKYGMDSANKKYSAFYAESTDFNNVTATGVVATYTFEYSADLEGEYTFDIIADPEFIINSDGNDVEFLFEGDSQTFEFINLCDHTFGSWTTVSAQCLTDGYKVRTCSKCQRSETVVLPALGHQAGDWVVTVQPGYTAGERVKKCIRCQIVMETEVLAPTLVPYIQVGSVAGTKGTTVTVPVTLANNIGIWGVRLFVYYDEALSLTSVSNGSIFNAAEMTESVLDMNPAEVPAAASAFADAGVSTSGIKAYCIMFDSDTLNANKTGTGTLINLVFTLPNTEGDYTVGIFADEIINVNADDVTFDMRDGTITVTSCIHDNGTWVTTTPATCTVDGISSRKCTKCGAVLETKAIAHTGHTLSSTWETTVAATCTTAGTKVQKCTKCLEVVNTQAINVLGHQASGTWVVTKPATCMETGLRVQYCTRTGCGAVAVSEEIALAAHTPASAWTVVTPSTCTVKGSEVLKCTVCQATLETREIALAAHTPGEWITTAEPDCVNEGAKEQRCTTCGNVIDTDTIPANGHTWATEFTIDVAATATKAGSKSRHCLYCSEKTDVTVIPATGSSKIGDVNGDNRITSRDVLLLKQYTSGKTVSNFITANADVDGNNRINSRDVLALKRILVNK